MQNYHFQHQKFIFFSLIFILILNLSINPEILFSNDELNINTKLSQQLQSLGTLKFKKLESDSVFKEKYELFFTQPLDHQNPEGEKFQQKITLSHIDESRPVVLVTEGYSMGHNYCQELAILLGANQIRVEHRYFGDSAPDSIDWQYLNITQAAADMHRITEMFKKIYKNKWISTGWSKGGQTVLIYRQFYPDDIDVTVAYDAPLNFALEETRIDQFFDEVGSKYCRDRLISFQRRILEKKKDILPLFKWYAKGKNYKYSIGLEKAFEYIVLEYPFSFWQYHKINCDSIPGENASADDLLEHLKKVVSFSAYSDKSLNSVSMYQFSTELGYYGYVQKNVSDLLSESDYSNAAFAPQDIPLDYNPDLMIRLNDWLQKKGNNILYIYAELDPWSASAVEPGDKTNALKMTLKGGNHFAFINNFPENEKKIILDTLKTWIDIENK